MYTYRKSLMTDPFVSAIFPYLSKDGYVDKTIRKRDPLRRQLPLFMFTQGYHELRVGGMLAP